MNHEVCTFVVDGPRSFVEINATIHKLNDFIEVQLCDYDEHPDRACLLLDVILACHINHFLLSLSAQEERSLCRKAKDDHFSNLLKIGQLSEKHLNLMRYLIKAVRTFDSLWKCSVNCLPHNGDGGLMFEVLASKELFAHNFPTLTHLLNDRQLANASRLLLFMVVEGRVSSPLI